MPYIRLITAVCLLILLLLQGCMKREIPRVDLMRFSEKQREIIVECINHRNLEDRDSCLMHAAEELRLPDLCEAVTLSDYKDWCYRKIATEEMNLTLCGKIRDTTIRNYCMGIVSGNTDYCRRIGKSDVRELCIRKARELHS